MSHNELHHIPDGDPILTMTGGAQPVIQIRMQRLATVEGLEVAIAPVFDALRGPSALRAFSNAGLRWSVRPPRHVDGYNHFGILEMCCRLNDMACAAEGEAVGPLAEARDPADPTVSADAAWCARAIACMIADWGLAERPSDRRLATAEVNRFLCEASEGLHHDRDADAIAAMGRARERLELWCETGE